MPIRVLMADDHAMFRGGLRTLLEREGDIEIAGETSSGLETLSVVRDLEVDVLLLDISMPGMTGTHAAEAALKLKPRLAIIMLTMHEDEHYMREAFKIGVRGFVLKKSPPASLVQAIRLVVQGRQYVDPHLSEHLIAMYSGRTPEPAAKRNELTSREQEVCKLLALGHTNGEISRQLFISERTVETHRANIMTKLNLRSRAELVRYAMESGLLKSP
ncbi:MAG: response regulator transcription factor [Candidatus Riflebacteria bacterium]|nr:response regulator transcription factor [Candidatus Riflebacteria bacterium]